MGPTSIIHAGEAGLTSVVEGMAKARGALPDSIREAADRKLGADSTLGKGVLAMVDTVTEESAKAKAAKAALAVEAAAASTAVAAAADEKAVALVEAADTAVKESRGRGGKVLLGGLALGAAAAGAYLVWRRRQQAAIESLSGEGQWAQAGGGTVSDLSAKVSSAASEVAEQVPDAASDAVDQVSDATSDAVDQVSDSAADIADKASDAAADAGEAAKSFNAQIDEVADSMASDVVDAIETSEGGVKGV